MIKTTRRNFLKGTAAAGTIAAFGGQAPFFKKALGQGKKSVVWGQTEPFTSSWDPSSHTILAQIYFDYDVFGQLIRTPMSQAAPDEIVYETTRWRPARTWSRTAGLSTRCARTSSSTAASPSRRMT